MVTLSRVVRLASAFVFYGAGPAVRPGRIAGVDVVEGESLFPSRTLSPGRRPDDGGFPRPAGRERVETLA